MKLIILPRNDVITSNKKSTFITNINNTNKILVNMKRMFQYDLVSVIINIIKLKTIKMIHFTHTFYPVKHHF